VFTRSQTPKKVESPTTIFKIYNLTQKPNKGGKALNLNIKRVKEITSLKE